MSGRDLLRVQFERCAEMVQAVLKEPYDSRNSMARALSPAGVKFYNKIARQYNSLFIDNKLETFREDTDANTVLHPKAQEIYTQVLIALDSMAGGQVARKVEVDPIFTGRNFAPEPNVCFVLMPFRADMTPIYDDHIKRVLIKRQLVPKRADDIFSNTVIIEDIWAKICSSGLIIADLTHKNPNVFYEVGIAHTVGKKIILLTQSEEDVPFDLRHLRHIRYEYTPRGMQLFEQQLENMVLSAISI